MIDQDSVLTIRKTRLKLALTGEAKKVYQRDYMRKRRAVRPLCPTEPLLDPLVVLDQVNNTLEDSRQRLEKVNDTIGEVAKIMTKAKQPTVEKVEVPGLVLSTHICPACGGKGYREFEAGLIRLACPECRGKK